MQGIPKERPLTAGIRLLRPLLPVTRKEIEDYCHEAHISWRTDATNDSFSISATAFARSSFLLRDFNPGIDGILLIPLRSCRVSRFYWMPSPRQPQRLQLTVPCPLRPLPFLPGNFPNSLRLQNRVILAMLPENAGVKHVEAVLSLLENKPDVNSLAGRATGLPSHDSIALGGLPLTKGFQIQDSYSRHQGIRKPRHYR